jgi:purine-binding chemotaxis protein CheW
MIKDVGGHAMIMVLDFARLIAQEFAEIAAVARNTDMAGSLANGEAGDEEETSDELQLVSFDVAEQEYAIAIEDVQEIVQVPEQIIHVPHSEAHVLGVMTLRKRLLPLVSLRRMFALPPRSRRAQPHRCGGPGASASVGVVMDSVNEVLRVAKSEVDAMPPLLAREGDLADISEICRLDGGKRLVSIISADNLFRPFRREGGFEVRGQLSDDEERATMTRLTKTTPPTTMSRWWYSAWARRSSACRSIVCRKSCGCPKN